MAIKIPVTECLSSTLAGIGYDEGRQILAVQFRTADVWHYAGVPLALWYDFREAPSKGSFYAKTIRGHYPGEKMTGSCPKCGDTGWLGEPCAAFPSECAGSRAANQIVSFLKRDHYGIRLGNRQSPVANQL